MNESESRESMEQRQTACMQSVCGELRRSVTPLMVWQPELIAGWMSVHTYVAMIHDLLYPSLETTKYNYEIEKILHFETERSVESQRLNSVSCWEYVLQIN